MTGTLFRRILFWLVALFMAAPLIVIAGVSVNAQRTLVFPPVGFSMTGIAYLLVTVAGCLLAAVLGMKAGALLVSSY